MPNINRLNADHVTYDIHDARLNTGAIEPADISCTWEDKYNKMYEGDIYLKTDTIKSWRGWKYIMHDNGVCECWATIPCQAVCTQNLLGNYVGAASISDNFYTFDYPVEFGTQPLCFMNGVGITNNSAQDSFWISCGQNDPNMGSNKRAPTPIMQRGSAGPATPIKFNVYFYAIGGLG